MLSPNNGKCSLRISKVILFIFCYHGGIVFILTKFMAVQFNIIKKQNLWRKCDQLPVHVILNLRKDIKSFYSEDEQWLQFVNVLVSNKKSTQTFQTKFRELFVLGDCGPICFRKCDLSDQIKFLLNQEVTNVDDFWFHQDEIQFNYCANHSNFAWIALYLINVTAIDLVTYTSACLFNT